jgi:hypothetical protein
MRKTYRVITILVIYLLSCIQAQAALVVCVKADGTARLASVDHGCPEDAGVAQECHTAASNKTGRKSFRHFVSKGRCCKDYPVGISAGQVAPREPEKPAAASVDAARPAYFAADVTCGQEPPAELGPEQTFPTHLKTVILLI